MLIVGGGCRGRTLGAALIGQGHAVRITTRDQGERRTIESTGAECWVGDPDRLVTLRSALDHVTIACWMLSCASGDADALAALHGTRLQYWLMQVIDTTVRGVIYEAVGSVGSPILDSGRELVRAACTLNAIPYALLDADPGRQTAWQHQAQSAIDGLLSSSA